jgi:hypothetical protein
MIPTFQADFWNLARENKGYYSWAQQERWRIYRALHRGRWRKCDMCYDDANPMDLVRSLFEDGLGLHPLLDIAFQAFARAEIRLGLRFVPQRSHEERLTGHLISELEAAIQMCSEAFTAEAVNRYAQPLYMDFVYSDLSRGGHFEKTTGGDFGLIFVIDLPDRPKLIRYAAIQAKRLEGSTSLDKFQFDTLSNNFQDSAAYLFYDCDFKTLGPPMMVSASDLKSRRDAKDSTASFSADPSFVFQQGLPLSLWLLTELAAAKTGASARNFESARDIFTRFEHKNDHCTFSRLAMVSIGQRFTVTPDIEQGLRITL